MVIEIYPTSACASSSATLPPRSAAITRFSFSYTRDPIFVTSLLAYCLNRFVLKQNIHVWLIHDYLNDFLCIPLLLPVILKVQALLRIRRHDGMPTLLEVLHNWFVFTVVFEVVLPRLTMFDSTADPWDSAAYLFGGLFAYVCWNREVRSRTATDAPCRATPTFRRSPLFLGSDTPSRRSSTSSQRNAT